MALWFHSVVTHRAFEGSPPLWTYAEMAKPLVQLMGREGYHIMVGSPSIRD